MDFFQNDVLVEIASLIELDDIVHINDRALR